MRELFPQPEENAISREQQLIAELISLSCSVLHAEHCHSLNKLFETCRTSFVPTRTKNVCCKLSWTSRTFFCLIWIFSKFSDFRKIERKVLEKRIITPETIHSQWNEISAYTSSIAQTNVRGRNIIVASINILILFYIFDIIKKWYRGRATPM